MPRFLKSTTSQPERDLKEVQKAISVRRQNLQVIQHKLDKCFHEDGGITMVGLELELRQLDEIRRKKGTDPTDSPTQLLIQGQQNQVVKFMEAKKELAKEQTDLINSIADAELTEQDLSAKLNRSKK